MSLKKRILNGLSSDSVWPLVFQMGKWTRALGMSERVFQRVLFQRLERQKDWVAERISTGIPEFQVSSGPFQGMQYPQLESAGSTLAPKLLGTYESEIAEAFTTGRLAQYEAVVDIGCAEGYYAVGIARSNPNCTVYAYDTCDHARALCLQLAIANHVESQLEFGGLCDAEQLTKFRGRRALVVSDCEGAEMQVFQQSVAEPLADSDLIIEVHENYGASPQELIRRLSTTHDCQWIRCYMDLQRARLYRHPLADSLPAAERILLLAECRSQKNSWLIATSKRQGDRRVRETRAA